MKNNNATFSLVDTHCHFDFDVFAADFSAELGQARQSYVEKVIIPSVGPQNWVKVKELSIQYPGIIYHALGIHPHFLYGVDEQTLTELRQRVEHRTSSCVAIGECGLDAMIDVPVEKQLEVLTFQLEIAQDTALPVILHSRKLHSQIARMLRRFPKLTGGVLHAFSGSYQQAKELVDLGLKIGVGGTITYPRANKTRQTISRLPLDCLVLETDAPDMPIAGNQGKPNHPQYLWQVLSSLAEIREESEDVLAEQLWVNSHELFQLTAG